MDNVTLAAIAGIVALVAYSGWGRWGALLAKLRSLVPTPAPSPIVPGPLVPVVLPDGHTISTLQAMQAALLLNQYAVEQLRPDVHDAAVAMLNLVLPKPPMPEVAK